MKKIMFVCTGNICRSPMAEHYMQKKVKDLNIENDFLIDSCGISAVDGQESTSNAITSMKKYGIDLNQHRAKCIQKIDIENFEYIICMTKNHKEILNHIYPKLAKNIYLLKDFDEKSKYKEVDDPWGLDINVYDSCAAEITNCIDILIQNIQDKK